MRNHTVKSKASINSKFKSNLIEIRQKESILKIGGTEILQFLASADPKILRDIREGKLFRYFN